MKLKLFFLSIIVLLSLVAYQKYSEYSALKSIDSYESCLAVKGSRTQNSYPPNCVTKLGTQFIGNMSTTADSTIFVPESESDNYDPAPTVLHTTDTRVTTYASSKAKLSFVFPKPLYVIDTYQVSSDGLGSGGIIISEELIDNNWPPSLAINYGVPYIDGKGGACIDENGEGNWKDMTIWGQHLSVCETNFYLSGRYPNHPGGNIQYSIDIGGTAITQETTKMYKNILLMTKFTD